MNYESNYFSYLFGREPTWEGTEDARGMKKAVVGRG
jgi:hypothetical protein